MVPGRQVCGPNLYYSCALLEDEKGRRIGYLSRSMWGKTPESSEPLLWEAIPNADERAQFIKQVQIELNNPKYHIYHTW